MSRWLGDYSCNDGNQTNITDLGRLEFAVATTSSLAGYTVLLVQRCNETDHRSNKLALIDECVWAEWLVLLSS
jgi:hypothetical protein